MSGDDGEDEFPAESSLSTRIVPVTPTSESLPSSTPTFLSAHHLSTVELRDGRLAVFGRTPEGKLVYSETDNVGPGEWVEVGGVLASRAEAVVTGDDIRVFFRADSGGLWYYEKVGGVWGAAQPLGGDIIGNPVAAVDGDGELVVVVLTAESGLFSQRLSNGLWSGYQGLGGDIAGPLELVPNQGDLHLFAVDRAGVLWTRVWLRSSDSWNDWTPLGGAIIAPTAAALGPDLYVFGINTEGGLWYRKSVGGNWGAWESLGGLFAGQAEATSTDSHLVVLATNPDGQVWQRTLTGEWNDWQALGGSFVSSPEATTIGESIYAFAIDGNGSVWSSREESGDWTEWISLAGILSTE